MGDGAMGRWDGVGERAGWLATECKRGYGYGYGAYVYLYLYLYLYLCGRLTWCDVAAGERQGSYLCSVVVDEFLR